MTRCGYGKLGENNLTDFELFDMCYEIIRKSRAGLSSSEISKHLHSEYGKDVPSRRISMNLNSDSRFTKARTPSKWGTSEILLWYAKADAGSYKIKGKRC